MGFKWDIKSRIATHTADLDAHTRNIGQVVRTGEYEFPWLRYTIFDVAMVADHLYAGLLWVPRKKTFDRQACYITIAGAAGVKVRLGIYNVGTNLYPGSLVLDSGTVDADSTGSKAITINQQLDKGIYFLAAISDGTPTLRNQRTVIPALGVLTDLNSQYEGWDVAQAYGTLPNPFPAGASLATSFGVNSALRVASLD